MTDPFAKGSGCQVESLHQAMTVEQVQLGLYCICLWNFTIHNNHTLSDESEPCTQTYSKMRVIVRFGYFLQSCCPADDVLVSSLDCCNLDVVEKKLKLPQKGSVDTKSKEEPKCMT